MVLNSGPLDWESRTLTTRPLLLLFIAPLLHCSFAPIETFPLIWSRSSLKKKYKKCLGKLCFEGQPRANNFLIELIFILLSHISQGDSLITWELDYMLLF